MMMISMKMTGEIIIWLIQTTLIVTMDEMETLELQILIIIVKMTTKSAYLKKIVIISKEHQRRRTNHPR